VLIYISGVGYSPSAVI